jgi:hypothetical protein
MDFRKARYCKGFPTFICNTEMLRHSIGSMLPRTLPSIPAGFCHKIHHSGSMHTVEGVGSWSWCLTALFNTTAEPWINLQKTFELSLADKAVKHELEAYRAVQRSTCPPLCNDRRLLDAEHFSVAEQSERFLGNRRRESSLRPILSTSSTVTRGVRRGTS